MEGARAAPGDAIGASLRIPPEVVEYTVRLYLDDEETGSGARVAEVLTHPRSMAQISFTPEHPLSSGPHSARVEYSDARGSAWTYEWRFLVE
jgi:hypothetical protein